MNIRVFTPTNFQLTKFRLSLEKLAKVTAQFCIFFLDIGIELKTAKFTPFQKKICILKLPWSLKKYGVIVFV